MVLTNLSRFESTDQSGIHSPKSEATEVGHRVSFDQENKNKGEIHNKDPLMKDSPDQHDHYRLMKGNGGGLLQENSEPKTLSIESALPIMEKKPTNDDREYRPMKGTPESIQRSPQHSEPQQVETKPKMESHPSKILSTAQAIPYEHKLIDV